MFVLTTCGLGATFLSLIIWIIYVKGYKKSSVFFESFGVNPLFIYVLAGVMATILESIHLNYPEVMIIKHYFYTQILQSVCGNYFISLIYALCSISILWIVGTCYMKRKHS
ncbi:hypothetical protein [Dysgonomonas mossii]|uniref:hypothetical protein n=1 Tax=Dysgonomonas mossii TaxID=163665 RepID=UPI0012FBBA73|nr:hypothetical protein [Dysgonomonas mossii]